MSRAEHAGDVRLDALGLTLAGVINTFLAAAVAILVVGPGSIPGESDPVVRAEWIAEHETRWQAGWLFWFAVTLSFAWSYFALGRHLRAARPWVAMAIGVALVAAAVDVVGVVVNIAVVPELAGMVSGGGASESSGFRGFENLAYALVNVAAFGLYSLAGLLLLPAAFATTSYPRWLCWLGVAEWSVAALATALLVVAPDAADGPLFVSFALYAPWVWGSAAWLMRGSRGDLASADAGA
ncbi:MAG: DUF4386 family protein [Miltoncostaeaceae bacterium]